MCNNNGHCRKFDAGAMCPSYRITREEKHLTRGRANTLRLAISGQIEGGLTSEPVKEALSLCVACKACKRECPTGVDMARMKFEVAAQNAVQSKLAWRDKLVAWLPHYAPRLAPFAALLNLRDRVPGAAKLSETVLKISAQRSLPKWRSATFWRQLKTGGPSASVLTTLVPLAQADVVLWVDTFNNAYDPEILHAALKVLNAAGRRVAVAEAPANETPLCCGRTFLASGLVDQARSEVNRVLDALDGPIQRGVPVLGLEPSCILTLRDESLALGLGEPAEALAKLAMTFEEYLAREYQSGTLTLPLKAITRQRALLHGHCHQKAHDAVRPIELVLGLIPGLEVELIQSSCCGMAGSFGYEAEHYEASIAMAELALLPKVREASDAGTVIIADGTSCRHQIHDGASTHALHVAQVLAEALA